MLFRSPLYVKWRPFPEFDYQKNNPCCFCPSSLLTNIWQPTRSWLGKFFFCLLFQAQQLSTAAALSASESLLAVSPPSAAPLTQIEFGASKMVRWYIFLIFGSFNLSTLDTLWDFVYVLPFEVLMIRPKFKVPSLVHYIMQISMRKQENILARAQNYYSMARSSKMFAPLAVSPFYHVCLKNGKKNWFIFRQCF